MDLDKLPLRSGIYKFYNNSRLLYVGKAVNIKNRVKNHYDNRKKLEMAIKNIDKALKVDARTIGVSLVMMQLLEAQRIDLDMDLVTDIHFIECGLDELNIVEMKIIFELKPPYNIQTRNGDEPCDILKEQAKILQRQIVGSFWEEVENKT